ncbi:hypothetical protein GE107_25510 [Cohnella sp. CFH 77786]|uniref:TM2 domain-containing protein n=1 Tax=Cohnella sp. CFH 77786 TaxID=2662265 RepID=UPI001C608292|nr:TM2 domain-containing protein [Cohnella sp. CFH 77786]MBW5449388.1 hypothetical protein [Cohnella sp. CFH 77786]
MSEWNRSNPYYHGYPPGYPDDPRLHPARKRKWIAGVLAFFFPGTGHFYLGQMVKGAVIMLLLAANICAIVFTAIEIHEVFPIVLLSLFIPILYFYNLFDAIQSTDIVNDRRIHAAWQAYPYGMPGNLPPSPMARTSGYAGPPTQSPSPEVPSPEMLGQTPPPEPLGPTPITEAMGQTPPPPGPMGHMQGPLPGSEGRHRGINGSAVVLLAAGAVALLLMADMGWTHWLFQSSGSMAGAVVLIGAGIGLWIWELRSGSGRKG